MVVANNNINSNKKCRQIAANSNCCPDVAAQCGVHRPMENILGFTRSHWMLQSGECLRCITTVAAMVNEFDVKQKTLTTVTFS
jgi:hypothetical protein